VDEARRLAQHIGDKKLDARLCQGAAAALMASQDAKDAIESLEKGVELSKDAGDNRERAQAQRAIFRIHFNQKDYEAALRAARLARSISNASQDKRAEAGDCLNIAVAFANCKDVEKAVAVASEAQELFQDINDVSGEARALSVIADLRRLQRDLEGALEAAEERLTILRDFGDVKAEAAALEQIAGFYLDRSNFTEAERALKEGLSVAQKAMDRKQQVSLLLKEVQIYVAQSQDSSAGSSKSFAEKALKASTEALSVAGKASSKPLRASALYWRAHALSIADRYDDALRTATEAAESFAAVGSQQGEARSLLLLSSLHNAFGRRDKAMSVANAALNLAQLCSDSEAADEARKLIERMASKPVVQQVLQQPVASPITSQQQERVAAAAPPSQTEANVALQPKGLDPEHVRKKLMAMVQDVIATDDELFLDSPFMESGMDSLSSVSLMSMVAKEFSMSLSPSLVFDFPTVRVLEAHLVEESRNM
jgi:tetratricopeptide (TPR) repeat protein/acyl carrier protein